MDVRCLLVVRVNDHLVDKLDQLVICCGGLQRVVIAAVIDGATVHVGQQLVDGAAVLNRTKQLVQAFAKFGLRRDAVGKLGDAWKHLRHDA